MAEHTCPTGPQISQYVLGKVGESRLASIADHLDACDRCRNRAEAFERERDSLLDDLQHDCGTGPFDDEPELHDALAGLLASDSLPTSGCRKAELPVEFGRYRVIAEIGSGAMGTVHLAYDTQLERQVALKVPHFRPNDDSKLRARFLREAKAAAAIRHANICQIFDAGEIDGVCFIVMSFVDGQPLSTLLDSQSPMAPAEAAELVRVIAQAMQEAHSQGVVHRDLKPGNILIGPRGEPVVTDFGLASRSEGPVDEVRLTYDGMLIGSPAYMSPEQVNGQIALLGPACDIYALGVILFELLTGELPFDGPVASVLAQIARDPSPRPSSRRPFVPPELDAICAKAMAKDPVDRFDTMANFAKRLEDFRDGRLNGWHDGPESKTELAESADDSRSERGSVPVAAGRRWREFARANLLSIVLLGVSTALLSVLVLGTVSRPSQSGTVRIEVEHPDGDVFIEGRHYTRDELQNGISLPAGTHHWQIKKDLIATHLGSFRVRPGTESRFSIP